MEYLKTGKLETRDLTPLSIDILKDDFDYYCIPFPKELKPQNLSWDVSNKTVCCRYTNNDLTVTQTISSIYRSTAIGNIAVDRYTVKIEKGDHLKIGFTTGAKYKVNGSNPHNGWFLYSYHGTLCGIGANWNKYTSN